MGPTEGRASLFAKKNMFSLWSVGKIFEKYYPAIMRPAGFGRIISAGRRDAENDFGRKSKTKCVSNVRSGHDDDNAY